MLFESQTALTLPPPLLSRRRPSMETPLDVLSRAASFVHANEEESKCHHTTSSSGVFCSLSSFCSAVKRCPVPFVPLESCHLSMKYNIMFSHKPRPCFLPGDNRRLCAAVQAADTQANKTNHTQLPPALLFNSAAGLC